MAAPRTAHPGFAGTPARCSDPPDNVDWPRRAIYWYMAAKKLRMANRPINVADGFTAPRTQSLHIADGKTATLEEC
jgi:hypothetical protein